MSELKMKMSKSNMNKIIKKKYKLLNKIFWQIRRNKFKINKIKTTVLIIIKVPSPSKFNNKLQQYHNYKCDFNRTEYKRKTQIKKKIFPCLANNLLVHKIILSLINYKPNNYNLIINKNKQQEEIQIQYSKMSQMN